MRFVKTALIVGLLSVSSFATNRWITPATVKSVRVQADGTAGLDVHARNDQGLARSAHGAQDTGDGPLPAR